MKRVKKFLSRLPQNAAYDVMPSPVGNLLIVASDQVLHCILWQDESASELCRAVLFHTKKEPSHLIIHKTKQQLNEYFQGKRQSFDIPLCIQGTDFQKQAWEILANIPYGETISYGEQALRLGDKNKARAVGMANGMNPISIIIPCHRVIGSNGKLTGFGGGLDNKALLLKLEKRYM
jgi:methylated-DNA-[protein]-cysteine S-methyltransferase